MKKRTNLSTYQSVVANLKEKIREARVRSALTLNAQLLSLYWEIGATIAQQERSEGWGAKTVERLSADLRDEFPDMQGLSPRNLRYMRDFAVAYPHFPNLQAPLAKLDSPQFVHAPLAQISWYHHITLLDKVKDPTERLFYIYKSVENGWSRNVMLHHIENHLYRRQGKAITNFELTLPKPHSDLARETLKNPYVFDFLSITEQMQERDVERQLTQHMRQFLLELGKGFAYVGNQYKLTVDGDEFALDLLFYNFLLHCFVIFELKLGEFKPEHAGKLNFYVNAIDAQLKGNEDRPTIGVLLCKTPNHTVIKYALKGISTPMGVADYKLLQKLPTELRSQMPTEEELEQALEYEQGSTQKVQPLSKIRKMISGDLSAEIHPRRLKEEKKKGRNERKKKRSSNE